MAIYEFDCGCGKRFRSKDADVTTTSDRPCRCVRPVGKLKRVRWSRRLAAKPRRAERPEVSEVMA